jgi:hypothetical protein
MITAEIYAHVLPAVRLLMQDTTLSESDPPPSEVIIHGRLWPYVTHAVEEIRNPPSAPADPPKQDRRSKVWQYIVRFWVVTTSGTELVAETDIETMQGTGKLPGIIEQYATEMHPDDALFPSGLVASDIKEQRLPQLRNNLGRYSKASLRFEYDYDGAAYVCEVDVTKPGA